MKKTIKTLVLLLAMITAGQHYAQSSLPFFPIPCSKLVPKNTDRQVNVEIAEGCREIWTTFKGLGLAGPFGRYVRHVYNNETSIVKNEFGVITAMRVYVTAIVRKKSGKLKVAYVAFTRDYMGGGQYGPLYGGWVSGEIRHTKYECVENLPDWLGTGPIAKAKTKEEKAKEKEEKAKAKAEKDAAKEK